MKKILIADDHPVVRSGLKLLLSKIADFEIIEEAVNAEQVFEILKTQSFDLMILDLSMPGSNHFGTLQKVHETYPELPVLILSILPEKEYAIRSLKLGASGYLNKESGMNELKDAIFRISDGHKYLSRSLSEQLAFNLETNKIDPPHLILSNRELQVMKMLASGLTYKEIAYELHINPKTVGTYGIRIREKLNLKNNAEIIHYCLKYELIT